MAWSDNLRGGRVLTLDRFAEIFGLNPVGFNQGTFEPVCQYGCSNGCNEFWFQGVYQTGSRHVTRDELATEILQAEHDLASFWGFPIAPTEKYKIFHYNGGAGEGVSLTLPRRPYQPRPRADHTYVIQDEPLIRMGRETVVSVASVDITIIDRNGDEYPVRNDIDCPAYIQLSLTVPEGTLASELEVYRPGHLGEREHMISGIRTTIDQETWEATIRLEPWKAIREELWMQPGDCGIPLNNGTVIIDLLNPETYEDSLLVARRWHDLSLPGVEFGWRGAPDCVCGVCAVCTLSYCPGCITASFPDNGTVQAFPARYDEDEGSWISDITCLGCNRPPDFVKIYYMGGYAVQSEVEYIVALLAGARLMKPACRCRCEDYDRLYELQTSLNFTSRNEGSYFMTLKQAENPFGTRRGEIDAYRKALQIFERIRGGAVTTGAL